MNWVLNNRTWVTRVKCCSSFLCISVEFADFHAADGFNQLKARLLWQTWSWEASKDIQRKKVKTFNANEKEIAVISTQGIVLEWIHNLITNQCRLMGIKGRFGGWLTIMCCELQQGLFPADECHQQRELYWDVVEL